MVVDGPKKDLSSGAGASGPARRPAARRLTPFFVAVLTVLAASAFVAARWVVAAQGDLSRFVVAGSDFVSPGAGIAVRPGPGYDGQFAYRLALDPTDLAPRDHGVAIDSPLRLQRITYPVLAFLASGGRQGAVPAALVVVNVLGLGLLALLSALLARDAGRQPVAGLLVVGFFGFCTSLGRDLTEITTVTFLVAGVLAWQRGRPVLAVLAFSAAVLSRESALLLYAAFVLVQLTGMTRRTRLLALLPLLAFAGWQVVCTAATGDIPMLSSGGKNLGLPLRDLVPAGGGWFGDAARLDRAGLITSGQLLALGVLVAAAGLSLRRSLAPRGVQAAWVVALLLVVSLSSNVWRGPADFRTAAELQAASAVLLLDSRLSLRVPATFMTAALLMTVLFRVISL
ncbi:MAG: hypothetical protein QOD70_1306 [Frankiales bacterium]|nr:hypothetical protein [Frankiales bacterium]